MYHYVGEGGMKGLSVDEFKQQLEYLQNNYTIVDLYTYLDNLPSVSKMCVLTFDDGLKCHYTKVFPILKDMGLTASFFIITQPLLEHKINSVHKIHLLLSKFGDDLINEFDVQGVNIEDARKVYYYENDKRALLKFYLNFHLPESKRDEQVREVFKKHFSESIAKKFYLSFGEIKKMSEAMTIGSHTHTHSDFSKLTKEEIKNTLMQSKRILEKFVPNIDAFSYPFGGKNVVSDRTTEVLKGLGFKCALTTIKGDNTENPDLFMLKRYDTIDLAVP